jgi:CubicO group peptidase (beta-lactamase class C family)
VLATVIFNLTGQRLDEYARTRLFEPLGITDFEWLGPSGNWTLDNPVAAWGLRLRARDLAKIGSVYLHGGRWKGQQVVPASWVDRSTTPHVTVGRGRFSERFTSYGYQWWVGTVLSGEEAIAGIGLGDQRLFILPDEQRLAVTIFAGQYDGGMGQPERILARILAARQSS